jgi:hypothetical protein
MLSAPIETNVTAHNFILIINKIINFERKEYNFLGSNVLFIYETSDC